MESPSLFVDDFNLEPWELALVTMMRVNKGIRPVDVVKAASDPASPLHTKFEWDDSEAAKRYRLTQAGSLIRTLRVNVVNLKTEEEQTTRYAVSVRAGDGQVKYVTTETALGDSEMRAQLLSDARRDMLLFRSKYALLSELAEVLDAMKNI